MNATRKHVSCCVAACFALAVAAPSLAATVYKWTDDSGTVNYSTSPPPNRSAKPLDIKDSRLTVYESYKPDPDTQARLEASIRQRIDTLDRVEQFKRQAALDANAPYSYRTDERLYQLWLQRCRADRRVDCDDPLAYMGYNGAYYPYGPVVVAPPRRRIGSPVLPVAPSPSVSEPVKAGEVAAIGATVPSARAIGNPVANPARRSPQRANP